MTDERQLFILADTEPVATAGMVVGDILPSNLMQLVKNRGRYVRRVDETSCYTIKIEYVQNIANAYLMCISPSYMSQ